MGNRVGQEHQNVIQHGQVAGPQLTEPAPPAQVQQPQGMMVTPNGMAGPTASEQAYDPNASGLPRAFKTVSDQTRNQTTQPPVAAGVNIPPSAAKHAEAQAVTDPNAPGATDDPTKGLKF